MDDVRLSIVVPTLNRPTLSATLSSFGPAGILGTDEVIVVWGDGSDPSEAVARVSLPCRTRVVYARADRPDYGNTQKTAGIREATGTHVCFMDDDDVYNPDALTKIRQALAVSPTLPHVFRVSLPPDEAGRRVTVWHDRKIRYTNVSTLGIVVPNESRIPSWPKRKPNGYLTRWGNSGNDAEFALECEKIWGRFVFREEVVATARP